MANKKYMVVKGKSHGGAFNGMIGTAIKERKRQVVLVFDNSARNYNSRTGGYWFIRDNVQEVN